MIDYTRAYTTAPKGQSGLEHADRLPRCSYLPWYAARNSIAVTALIPRRHPRYLDNPQQSDEEPVD